MKIPAVYLIAGAAVGAALLWAAKRSAETGESLAYSVGEAPVDLVNGIIGGTVTTVTGVVGIPKTNLSECEKAKAEGRTWDASFACPAADFIKYLWK